MGKWEPRPENVYIIIPAYNEEDTIESVISEWHPVVCQISSGSRLIIINDGSKDSTAQKVRNLESRCEYLTLVDKRNSGHGPSCLVGYKYALSRRADWVFQTDSDGQTLASEFESFWADRKKADFLIGYRTVRGDGVTRWLVSRALRLSILAIFRTYIRDSNVPFRLMKTSRLGRYLDIVPGDFFLANSLLTVLLAKGKENILWKQITFRSRQGGVPTVPLGGFFALGVRILRDFHRFNQANKNAL
jgi:dolichol-phosphate mannosyltransferase